jgi:hypothetical protein
MEQDELAQGDAQDPENQVVDESDEVSNSDVLISSENEEEFDLGVLEPPLPIDDQILTEPSKLRLFLRRLLPWVVAILVIFTLGVGATWLARVVPQQKEIDNLEQEMENLLNAAELSAFNSGGCGVRAARTFGRGFCYSEGLFSRHRHSIGSAH